MARSRARTRLLVSAVCVAVLFAVVAGAMPHSPGALRASIAAYGAAAPVVCILVWAALTPALFSGAILAGATGLLFGPATGTLVAVAGATAGGAVAFTIARRFGAAPAAALSGPRLAALRERVEHRAFRTIALLRVAPAVPTTLLNYAAGLTRIRLRTFVAATVAGGTPRIFIYVALGGSLADPSSPLAIVALSLFGALGLAGAVVTVRGRLRSRRATA